jgi:hypothetical protein
MNNLEKKMVSVLQDLKDNHHVVGVKAEFEAEGTRLEEAMRLKEVVLKAGLDLTIKIGGCEAIKDMYEARVIGVNKIVAPMVETAYALKKYLAATKLVFCPQERKEVGFFVNIETITGFNNLDEMLLLPEIKDLDGIVLGRGDMTGSMALNRDEVNSDKIFHIARIIGEKIKGFNLDLLIGGGVSAESLPFFRKLPQGILNRYETRKVIFQCPQALEENADKAILKALGFELMWLKNKKDFYGAIHKEDGQRLSILEARYKKVIARAGGIV